MSKQGWLKREIETVQREVATWPAWKRGEGMDDVKRYKLSQDARYGDGAFVIPAGQVMVREADYDALREQNRVLREALQAAKYELAALFPIPSAPTVHAALEVCGNNNEADARCIYLAYEAICAALTATSQPEPCTNHFSDGSKIFPSRDCCKPATSQEGQG